MPKVGAGTNGDGMLLEERGYTVIEAVDGEDAVLKFSANQDRIRLVIPLP